MAGIRVLISGMGGELGWRVCHELEQSDWVGQVVGIDTDPPRGRLLRAGFHRVVPGAHDQMVDLVTGFNPHVVVHLAVWEPFARTSPDNAARLTDEMGLSILGAAAECQALESIVLRSGIEVYGRSRGSVTRPSEQVTANPTNRYGESLLQLEQVANGIGRRAGVSVTPLRLAPVMGPHIPSPLGRLLRQRVVPFSALADPPFAVVHRDDAAHAFVAAAQRRVNQPVNIVAPGAITALQACRRGRGIPLPLLGPEWTVGRRISYYMGAPVPDHVQELLHRGRLADNALATDVLGFTARHTTSEVIDELFNWPTIVRTPARIGMAS